MRPLLRSLDLTAAAGTASSIHNLSPIHQAAAARSHGFPILLSLGLTPLLIYGLSLSLVSPAARQAVQGTLRQAGRSVGLLLHEPSANPAMLSPAVRDGSRGAGHVEGMSALDPRLAALTVRPALRPVEAVDPESLGRSPRAEPTDITFLPTLPPQVGGNGLTRGAGRDAGLGTGETTRPVSAAPPAAAPDFRLVATRQVTAHHRLAAGQAAASREPVKVRILIGEDGVPIQATVVSGPAYLHAEALEAAREWRFEPLGPHGLKAPVPLVLTFHPTLLRPR